MAAEFRDWGSWWVTTQYISISSVISSDGRALLCGGRSRVRVPHDTLAGAMVLILECSGMPKDILLQR